ncbi:Conjugal transfer protein TraD [Candidatus Rubidus massiliensis]|nr:Conjugal transfer protein TraD [Candidatus Rubidus massiliensis]
MKSVINEKAKLGELLEKIQEKQRRIQEKEKRLLNKSLIEIGKMAYKANIHKFDSDLLYGAFLEIQKKSNSEEARNIWKSNLQQSNSIDELLPIAIKFEKITKEVDSTLRHLKFKWNRFRKEYFGRSDLETVKKICEKYNGKMEIIK